MTLEPELSLGVSEAEPGRLKNVYMNGEEDEGTVAMRAECVIITDEGDDLLKDRAPQEDQRETITLEETPLPNPEGSQDGGEAVEEVGSTEATPESFTQSEKSEAAEHIAEAPPATGDGAVQGGVETGKNGDRETKSEGQHRQWEDPTSVQVQSLANALEGTAVVLVPVYSKVQPSTLTLELEAEPEAEAAFKAQDPAPLPGQFQEVPLADPQGIQRTEARPEEKEPLLLQADAPNTQARAAPAACTETNSPTRASQREETSLYLYCVVFFVVMETLKHVEVVMCLFTVVDQNKLKECESQRLPTNITMFCAVCAITLLCLVSGSLAAPLACEVLVRPFDQLDLGRLEGRWAMVAGALSDHLYLQRFKQRDSATINFSSNTSDTNISYSRSIHLNNQCLYHSYNISLEGSSFTYDGTDKSNLTGNFVHTSCQDCVLMRMNVESGKRQHFYLFSRRRQLEQKEMEEFRAQVKCLNMPPPAVLDPTKELCPEETAGDPAAN
ncbi:uncharacterized protein LOC117948160 [Etheostoma cragini]|uniref:uncharacterized protein LOC117948160 n=1 Tax=Etheostoma cragini TaxID=417921 RepID=UPI00155E3DBD|nr:uncharacterized protein LOC117948160 [Etheostoma cragini]